MLILKKEINALSLSLLFVLLINFIYSSDYLPDYEAYMNIYNQTGEMLTNSNIGPIFVLFIKTVSYLELPYSVFRSLIIIISTCMMMVFIGKWKYHNDLVVFDYVLFISASIIFIEFFMVRLRAGFCIAFFLVAIYIFLKKSLSAKLIALSILIPCFFIHKETAISLTFFLIIPLCLLWINKRFSIYYENKKINLEFIIIILFMIIIILNYAVYNYYSIRGAHLYSNLNPLRILAINVGCILLITSYIFNKKFQLNYNILIINYCIMSAVVLMVSILGYAASSGEAISRILGVYPMILIFYISVQNLNKLEFRLIVLSLFINSILSLKSLIGA
ncbi:EpsG family protein [Polynucleobacter sp. Nonnen-W13]|nr:EpsG family protein [Polynucleobacter sp. Nonnen-W13]